MGFYEKYLLPKLLNLAMKSPDMTGLRRELVPRARGRVLELGIGSGLNLPFYSRGVQVIGVDPSLELQAYARDIAADQGLDVSFLAQSAESLPFENHYFDSVVITWTLCTIGDPEVTLGEVRRVMKPSGELIFAEHGRSPEASVEKWQDRLNPWWGKIAGGCNLNRRPDKSLADSGFKFEELSEGYLAGPRWATYNYRGVATPI
ncbi:MAG: class I SAM-dependent methyltransferase [Pseudomonadales bacterium]